MEELRKLPKELEQKCHQLDVKYHEFKKWNRPATACAVIAFVAILVLLVYVPEEPEREILPNEVYISLSIFVISVALLSFFYMRSSKYRISGFELNTVRVYCAFKTLENYQKDKLDTQFDKSEDNVNSLLVDLQKGWGDFSEKNPSFKSLAEPIDQFLKNLENRLLPAFKDKDQENIKKIQNTLLNLIMFFQSDLFSDIERVNQELKQFEDISSEKEHIYEKIKKNKHLVTMLLSFLIIGVGWALSWSSRFLDESISIETQLTLWAAISVPFTIWLLHSRYKK